MLWLIGDSDIDRWPSRYLPVHTQRVKKYGYSGATLEQVVHRVREHIQNIENDTNGTVILVVCAGENDIGQSISLSDTLQSLQRLLSLVSDNKSWLRLLFLGPKIEPWLVDDASSRKQYIRMDKAMNRAFLKTSTEEGEQHTHYLSCITMFCGDSANQSGALFGGKAQAEGRYFDNDELHLSDNGYELWQKAVQPLVDHWVD